MERLDKITQYIDGTLSEADKTAFESEINADANLTKDVAFHFIAAQAAKEVALRRKKETFLEYLQNNPAPQESNPPTSKLFKIRWLMASLIAVILCLVGYFIISKPVEKPTQTPNQLFMAYFSHKNIETTMGSSDTSEYQRCEAAYNNKNIPLAIERLLAYIAKDANNTTAIELLVKCYIEQGQWNEAEQTLLRVETIPNFLSAVRWYRAGIALGKGNATNARNILNEIIKANDRYSAVAKTIEMNLE